MVKIVPIEEKDSQKIIKWRNSALVQPFFIYQKDITLEEHIRWFRTKVMTGQVAQFIIVVEGEKEIGSVYLQSIDMLHKKAEFGIFIGEEWALGRGYGTEATKLILEYAFDKLYLHKVYLRVYENNTRAIQSYKKVGFQEEAFLRDDVYVNQRFHNIILMAILNGEEKK